jgi:hypothetical protein
VAHAAGQRGYMAYSEGIYDDFNKALDACHKAGVGLISMKQMRSVKDAPKFLPDFEKMGLTRRFGG